MNDVIVLAEEPQHVKHVLITRYERADFVRKPLYVALDTNLCQTSLDPLEPWVILLRALFSMSFLILEQHDLVCLKLSKGLLNLFFCVCIRIANILICIKHLIIEEFGKLDCCLVQYRFILVDANDVGYTSFQKDSSYLLGMAACNIDEL